MVEDDLENKYNIIIDKNFEKDGEYKLMTDILGMTSDSAMCGFRARKLLRALDQIDLSGLSTKSLDEILYFKRTLENILSIF